MDDDARRVLADGAWQILGRPLSPPEEGQVDKYLTLLIKWGSVHRLVGRTSPRWIIENLFLDSLLFLRILPESMESLMDFGSGAGIPGIPIKIVRPRTRLTLLESRQRLASFLSTVIRELSLQETRVVNARAERAPGDLADSFDAVVVRCAGKPETTLPLALSFVKPGGLLVRSAPPDVRSQHPDEAVVVPGFKVRTTRNFVVRRR